MALVARSEDEAGCVSSVPISSTDFRLRPRRRSARSADRRPSKTGRSEQNERPITRSETGARGIPIVPYWGGPIIRGNRRPGRRRSPPPTALRLEVVKKTTDIFRTDGKSALRVDSAGANW